MFVALVLINLDKARIQFYFQDIYCILVYSFNSLTIYSCGYNLYLFQVVTKDVDMKVPGTIHFIKATDQYIDDNGGYATLDKGGPGQNEVTIHMKSKRNHGFNFIVEIYGK